MPATVRFGAVEVQAATYPLLLEGVSVALGARAFESLLDVVWRGQVVEENNLHVQVSTLRRLLGPSVIANVTGRG